MVNAIAQRFVLLLSFSVLEIFSAYSYSSKISLKMNSEHPTRRTFFSKTSSIVSLGFVSINSLQPLESANSIGPVKISLINPVYLAAPCPPDRPIPGMKAMKGMRGLCVTVKADLESPPPNNLEKVGIYGFVIDENTGNSVLANNPDLSTDAGQFGMIENVSVNDRKVEFDFVAAVDPKVDLSQFENGIGNLTFRSLRLISFPGGQQYGTISPCEMNEFSSECETWEEENGPYKKGNFMVKSNPRTKGG